MVNKLEAWGLSCAYCGADGFIFFKGMFEKNFVIVFNSYALSTVNSGEELSAKVPAFLMKVEKECIVNVVDSLSGETFYLFSWLPDIRKLVKARWKGRLNHYVELRLQKYLDDDFTSRFKSVGQIQSQTHQRGKRQKLKTMLRSGLSNLEKMKGANLSVVKDWGFLEIDFQNELTVFLKGEFSDLQTVSLYVNGYPLPSTFQEESKGTRLWHFPRILLHTVGPIRFSLYTGDRKKLMWSGVWPNKKIGFKDIPESSRTHPKFFIVAPPQAGIDWVKTALISSPDVYLPFNEDLTYFNWEVRQHLSDCVRSLGQYERIFSFAPYEAYQVGDASEHYLNNPSALTRIREYSPWCKIICVLRNPTDAAISLYTKNRARDGLEPCETFEDAWQECIINPGKRLPHNNYATIFRLQKHLEELLFRFDKNRILFINFDELLTNSDAVLTNLQKFLNLSELPGSSEPALKNNSFKGAVSANVSKDCYREVSTFFHQDQVYIEDLLSNGNGISESKLLD